MRNLNLYGVRDSAVASLVSPRCLARGRLQKACGPITGSLLQSPPSDTQNPAARNRPSLPQRDALSHVGHGERVLREQERNGKFVALPRTARPSCNSTRQSNTRPATNNGQAYTCPTMSVRLPPSALCRKRTETTASNRMVTALWILPGSLFP